VDSGWRFLSGYESDEYMNDPDIVPFLDAPIGSAFERPNGAGEFVEVHDFTPGAE
jgi:hypothetical protein